MQAAAAGNLFWGIEAPDSLNERPYTGSLTLTVGSDGSVTCGGYSDRWWASGSTPPTAYVAYSVTGASSGQPAFGTTMTQETTRTSTAGSPTVVCDAGIVWGTITIYSAETGGRALTSFTYYMQTVPD